MLSNRVVAEAHYCLILTSDYKDSKDNYSHGQRRQQPHRRLQHCFERCIKQTREQQPFISCLSLSLFTFLFGTKIIITIETTTGFNNMLFSTLPPTNLFLSTTSKTTSSCTSQWLFSMTLS